MAETREPYWNPSMKTVSNDDLQAFAKRLHKRMTELGLTQSELARRAFGVVEDESGTQQVKDRDKVSLYLRGKGLPGEEKMRSLAKVLKMSLKDLAPPIAEVGAPRPPPARPTSIGSTVTVGPMMPGVSFEMTGKDMAVLRCNQKLRAEDAIRLAGLIHEAMQHAKD